VSVRSLPFLLLPAEAGRMGKVIEGSDGWTALAKAREAGADVVVWARWPLPFGTPVRRALRSAMDRERAASAARRWPPKPFTSARVHRLPPPNILPSGARNALRAALLGGTLIELAGPGAVPRVLDAVAEAAGVGAPISTFRPGSGGAGLAKVRREDGTEMILRFGRAGSGGDPRAASDALVLLEVAGMPLTSRLVARGRTAGASWTAETVLPGRPPRRLSASLTAEVVRFCAALPPAEGANGSALADDLEAIAVAIPHRTGPLRELIPWAEAAARSVPTVLRHGDLWAGNLLASKGRLSGVVDWDSWHPAGIPGADVLHLLAMDEGRRIRRGLGSVWLGRPWQSKAFLSATRDYWPSLGFRPDRSQLELVGVAWWACHVAGSLRRLPHLANDEAWLSENVEAVLSALAGRPGA
jgi:hypothetical protein